MILLGVHSQPCLLDKVLLNQNSKQFLMVSFLSTRPKKHPVFLVDLVLDKNRVRYCTPLENFETTVIELMDMGIQNTYNVPQLEKVKYNLNQCHNAFSILRWTDRWVGE